MGMYGHEVSIPVPYEEYASSEMVTFFVGPEEEAFNLPSNLVATNSAKLYVMVSFGEREFQKKAATLEGTDRQTCLRFGNWAHIGSYDAGEDGPPSVFSEMEPSSDLVFHWQQALLGHARLYVFGDCFGISALKDLCIQNLNRALRGRSLIKGAVQGFIELVSYSFANTVDGDDCQDPLRELVIGLSAKWYGQLINHVQFQELLVPAFSVPLLKKINQPGKRGRR